MTHYIVMNGSRGCLPDHCTVYDTVDDAIDGTLDMFDDLTRIELGNLMRDLRQDWYHQFPRPRIAGADYAEVVECDCPNPEDHDNG